MQLLQLTKRKGRGQLIGKLVIGLVINAKNTISLVGSCVGVVVKPEMVSHLMLEWKPVENQQIGNQGIGFVIIVVTICLPAASSAGNVVLRSPVVKINGVVVLVVVLVVVKIDGVVVLVMVQVVMVVMVVEAGVEIQVGTVLRLGKVLPLVAGVGTALLGKVLPHVAGVGMVLVVGVQIIMVEMVLVVWVLMARRPVVGGGMALRPVVVGGMALLLVEV